MGAEQLPRPVLPAGSIDLDGTAVAFRSLSRHQALKLEDYRGRPDEAEDYIVSCGTGVSLDEAAAWRDAVTLELAGRLVDAILDISGLTKDDAGEDGADPKD